MTAQRGDSGQAASENRQRAAELIRSYFIVSGGEWTELCDLITEALDAAEQRGRESVGLGDFLPDPCRDEHRARASHIAETYGDWLSCTLRRGHGGEHEHEDSGMKWSTR